MVVKKSKRKKSPPRSTAKTSKRRSRKTTGSLVPDVEAMKRVDPHSEGNTQPGWIAEQFPSYVDPHPMHRALTSVRSFTHKGHKVQITTTYEIQIDGRSVQFHAFVDNDGRVLCHSTPYESFSSTSDLVKQLMDRFPQIVEDANDQGQHPVHRHEP